MTTVKEFKDLGVEFVRGDCCVDNTGRYDGTWYQSPWSEWLTCKVESFVWRQMSTLPVNPKFEYETSLCQRGCLWRPLLKQQVIENKPVFTQEMADKNALPPVRSNALISWVDDVPKLDYECEMVFFAGEVGVVLIDGVNYSFDVDINANNKATFKPIDTRTPKQKAVDEAVDISHQDGQDYTYLRGSMEKLYDAGLLK
jgi:hypothetical protein